MKRKFTSTGLLFMVLVVALASLAVAYGLWSKTLTIDGTVNTGSVHAYWSDAYTDDDDVMDDVLKDPNDLDDCDHLGVIADPDGDGFTSCDPSSPGPLPTRYDKDVARCDVEVDPANSNNLIVTVDNAYPSYYCTVWGHVTNDGSIPVKFEARDMQPVSGFVTGDEISVDFLSDIQCGDQLDEGDTVQTGGTLHVEQNAVPGTPYVAKIRVRLVQWNEFDPLNCPPAPFPGP